MVTKLPGGHKEQAIGLLGTHLNTCNIVITCLVVDGHMLCDCLMKWQRDGLEDELSTAEVPASLLSPRQARLHDSDALVTGLLPKQVIV